MPAANEATKAQELERGLKHTLRQIDVLVGKKLALENIDKELADRIQRLDTSNGSECEDKTNLDSAEVPAETIPSPVSDQRTVRQQFVARSLQLLSELDRVQTEMISDRAINDRANDQELLGLMDQRMIHTMLETIVCWGIYPCLIPGVGMPLSRRVRTNNSMEKDLFTKPTSLANDIVIDPAQSSRDLWCIMEPLVRFVTSENRKSRFTTLGSILSTRHLPDLYAALLQLAYAPPSGPAPTGTKIASPQSGSAPQRKKKSPADLLQGKKSETKNQGSASMKESSSSQPSSTSTLTPPPPPQRSNQLLQKESSAKLFHDLFWSSEASKSLEALTILLSSSPLQPPTPVWMRTVCGRFLSQILLRPGGVRVVLEYMQGGSDHVKLDQLEKVAKLVSSVPDQITSVQEYYHVICPELVEILELDLGLLDTRTVRFVRPSPQLVRTATFVIGKLVAKNKEICQAEIVARVVEPLWIWGTRPGLTKQKCKSGNNRSGAPGGADTIARSMGDCDNKPKMVVEDGEQQEEEEELSDGLDQLVVSEYHISKAVLWLHGFLVGNEPSPLLFNAFLSQASLGLYQLYAFATMTKSGLRQKAKEIIQTYLRVLEPAESLEVLKSIVMRRRPTQSPLLSSGASSTSVNKTIHIDSLVDMGNQGEAYFAPGPSGGIVIRKRKEADRKGGIQLELDVDLFLEFLAELEPTPSAAAMAEGKGTVGGELTGDLYMYLLDEYQAAKARGNNSVAPRKMLTMLQLILSMTQNLGSSIMSKVTQIIQLANNILEHQVGPKESNESDDDKNEEDLNKTNKVNMESQERVTEDEETDDVDLLGLVLTLLSAILNENEDLTTQDLHLLAMTQSLLQNFAQHPLVEVRRLAHDLLKLIPVRLASADKSRPHHQKTEQEIAMEKYASALAALQDSLLPVRAHGLAILREMIFSKSCLMTEDKELDHALDIFVQHVQEPDSFIYLNAVKGLAALTDIHGAKILAKLVAIYVDEQQRLDTRLRIGEALVQTVRRCGEALVNYTDVLLPGVYKVMNTPKVEDTTMGSKKPRAKQYQTPVEMAEAALLTPEEVKAKKEQEERKAKEGGGEQEADYEEEGGVNEVSVLRSSALTVLATCAETCPLAFLSEFRYLLDWVLTILDLDPQVQVRRGATLVIVLLFRGLGYQLLYQVEGDLLKRTLRTLRYLSSKMDEDELTRAQARAGLADLDEIVRQETTGANRDEASFVGRSIANVGRGLSEIRYK